MPHHFPRRVDLVGAALERLAEQRIGAMRGAAAELPQDPAKRVAALLDLVWADFSGPLFKVFVKAWVAADDDPELYQRLVPLERVLAREIGRSVAEFSAGIAVEDLDVRNLAVLAAARGLALTQAFEPHRHPGVDRSASGRPMLQRLILAP